MSRLKFFIPVIIFVILGVGFWFAKPHDPNAMPSAVLGKDLPDFSLPNLHKPSQIITKKDLLGEYALINVWGTWCPTCVFEHPFLMELAEQGVAIYGLNWDEEGYDPPRQWLKKRGDPYRYVLADFENQLGIRLGIFGAPETFLISPEGKILHRIVGELNRQRWQNELVPLIQGQVSKVGE